MARRNIFDRDTGAGYYSDALGNFLENIPSFYGQIAREKRLERQRIEDTNYRNQAYNNQLLQQSRNNIRQKKLDDLNERKFNQKVKYDEYTQAYQIAKANYDATGDYSQLAQVEQRYSPETYDANKYNKIKAGTTDRQIFDANYLDWDSLSLDEKYGKGNELQDLISESSRLMKTGDPRNKINYQNINKILRNEFKTYTKNSGQLIKDKDLWSGQKGQYGLKSYESNERDIKSYEKQLDDLQSKINEIIPQSLARVKNPTTLKDAGYSDRQIQELSILNNRLENLKIKKVKLMDKNLEITDGFRYPIFNIDPTGEDYALEGMKSEKPVEQETNITENNQEKLEKMDADILSSIGDLDDAKINELMSVLDSDNPEDLNNYLFGFEEGETDLVEGETSTAKPIQTDLANVETGDEIEKPIVAETETQDKIDVSDTIEETVDEDIDVVDAGDEGTEPDQGAGSILSNLPIGTLSAGKTQPIGEIEPDKDLFSTEPEKEISAKKKDEIKTQEEFYRKKDKNFDAGLNASKNIFDSNIRDASGNKINITKPKDFFNQIKSMANRIKQINEMPEVKTRGTRGVPRTFVKSQQLLLEQKQLYRDLFELKNKLKNVKNIYFPQIDSQGNKTGGLTKRKTSTYNQSLNSIISKLPKDYDLKFKKDPVSQSRYEKVLGY